MINAGFNPLQQISEKTGKSVAQLKEEMSKGAISAEMVQQAFIDATSAGGKFYNMSENASKTINGQISMLQDALDNLFNELGIKSEGFIIKTIQGVTGLVQNYEKIGKVLVGLVATYGAYRTAVILATAAEQGKTVSMLAQAAATKVAAKAQALLNKTMLTNPYVALTVVIGGLITAMVALHDDTTLAAKVQDEYNKLQEEAAEKEKAHANAIQNLISKVNDETQALIDREAALLSLKTEYPTIFSQYDLESLKLADLLEIKKKINEEDAKRRREQAKEDYNQAKSDFQSPRAYRQAYEDSYGYNASGLWGARELVEVDLYNLVTRPWAKKNLVQKPEEQEKEQWAMLLAKRQILIEETKQEFADKLNNLTVEQLDDILDKYKKGELGYNPEEQKMYKTQPFNDPAVGEELKKKYAYQNQQVIDVLEAVIGTKKSQAETVAPIYGIEYENAEKEWKKAKKKLTEIEKDRHNFTKAQYDAAVADEKSKRAAFEKLGGDTKGKEEKKETKEAKEYNAKLAQNEKVRAAEKNAEREKLRSEKDLAFKLEQARIDSLKESSEKIAAQRKLDNEKELEELRRQKEDYIEKVVANEKAIHDAREEELAKGNDSYKKKAFDEKGVREKVDTTTFDKVIAYKTTEQQNEQLEAERKSMQEYLIEYGSFEEKKLAIRQQYYEKIQAATTEGEAKALAAEGQKVLKELDQSMNRAYQNIFKDPTKMSLSTVKDAIKLAKDEIKKITDKGALNEEDMQNVKILQEALEKLQQYADSAPFAGFGDGLDGVVSKLNSIRVIKQKIADAEKSGNAKEKKDAEDELAATKETLAKNLAGVGVDAFANGLTIAADAMQRIADISGDPQLKQTADILNGTANVVSSTATGAATGGWIGALVGGLTAIMSEVTGAIIDSQVAIAQNQKAMEDYKHNMEMLALSMDEDVYSTMFGESLWSKIEGTREKLKKAEQTAFDYSSQYRRLSEEEIKYYNQALQAEDKSILEWYKSFIIEYEGVLYSMIGTYAGVGNAIVRVKGQQGQKLKDMFSEEDLFDQFGVLRPEKIEEAKIALESLRNMKLEDTGAREKLEDAIDYAEKIIEYEESLKEAAKDYMGSIGDSLGDSIVNGILKGEDALENFNDVAGGIIEQIAKDFASSWMIDNYLKTFETDMQNAFLSGEAKDITEVVGKIVAGLPNVIDAAETATKEILDMTSGTGYDLYEKYASESSQEASRRGYETLSEDTGNELVGRALAQYESNLRIEESARLTKESIDLMMANQIQMKDIAAESRALIADSYLELQQIRENTGAIIKPIKNLSDKIDTWNDKIMSL